MSPPQHSLVRARANEKRRAVVTCSQIGSYALKAPTLQKTITAEEVKPSARVLPGSELRRRPPRDKKPVLKAEGIDRLAFRI
jgi:hypothetical protein